MYNGLPPVPDSQLKLGDILLMKDKTHGFYSHIVVVTQVDIDQNTCQVAHFDGLTFPYALAQAPLPPKELIEKLNVEFHIFRLKDQHQAVRAAEILQKWCLWAVPYDKNRFKKAEQAANEFFGIQSNLFGGEFPKIEQDNPIRQKLADHYHELNQSFKTHYRDVIKYAARREISPVRPKLVGEPQTGFNCLQGILIAFQVSYAQDRVPSVKDRWLSNKNTHQFISTEIALTENFNEKDFIALFPPAFQLNAKHCTIDTFQFALEQDKAHIEALGSLDRQSIDETLFFEGDKMLTHYLMGRKNRNKLLDEVISPRLADQSISDREKSPSP